MLKLFNSALFLYTVSLWNSETFQYPWQAGAHGTPEQQAAGPMAYVCYWQWDCNDTAQQI
jgi:hypothetical protein